MSDQQNTTVGRLVSVDVLRGFTMFWIIGGAELFRTLARVWPSPITRTIGQQMSHLNYGGFRFYDVFFPVIRLLWTSSYVLVACGYSLLLLAVFYWIIEVKQYKKWAFFFVVIGMNPIIIYMLQKFVNFNEITSFFLQGVVKHAGTVGPIIMVCGVLTVKWLLLRFLYQHKIFIKV